MHGHLHLLSAFILGLGVSGHLVTRRDSGAAAVESDSRPGCALGTFHPVGDRWFTTGHEGCLKYTCEQSGVVSSQPCPRVAVPLGCSLLDGNQGAEYPECCPRRECHPQPSVPVSEATPSTTEAKAQDVTSTPSSATPSSTTASSSSASTPVTTEAAKS